MPLFLNRRSLLAATAAVTAASLTGVRHARAQGDQIQLTAERRVLDVNGRPASVFGIRQVNGTAGVVLDPGQRFAVNLVNRSREPTIIHWHGQTPPVRQDGVADTGLETVIAAGAAQAYDYAPRPGTHWMHSHHGLQEQVLMAAPLIVRTAEDAAADVPELTVMLHDFSFRDPPEILAGLTGAKDTKPGGAMPGMNMPADAPDLNDIEYDAYLANDRTLADPSVVRVGRGARVRLRLINGAASTAFWIDLGALEGTVLAVDGNPVKPLQVKQIPMAQAQRVDVILTIPADGGAFPVLAQREGDRKRTGVILATPGATVTKVSGDAAGAAPPVDNSMERQLQALAPPGARAADVVHKVELSGAMMPYSWLMDGRTWAGHLPLRVSKGQRVEIEMSNRSAMAHPMHLHGHHFQVTALNGTTLSGAVRDTVLVPANGSVRVAFDADNPGRWLFHCHNLYHMAVGMMSEVSYGEAV
jgi:FtsP/CotA-like multicopper oxidase with cupredoxin domain